MQSTDVLIYEVRDRKAYITMNRPQLTGRSFLPGLLTGPFQAGLRIAFAFSIACCLIAAAASWSRGARFVAAEHELITKPTSD